jgi:hypothetical protein
MCLCCSLLHMYVLCTMFAAIAQSDLCAIGGQSMHFSLPKPLLYLLVEPVWGFSTYHAALLANFTRSTVLAHVYKRVYFHMGDSGLPPLRVSKLQLIGPLQILTSLSRILARSLWFMVGREFVRGLRSLQRRSGDSQTREIGVFYGLTQNGLIVGFGQSTSPFPFVVRCKQHSSLYTCLI